MKKTLSKSVEQFNVRCPIGTRGTLRRDNGELIATEVREKAFVLSGHSAVAFFAGISGCYLIDRFKED